jgi:Tfp pilus assembly protein FimT
VTGFRGQGGGLLVDWSTALSLAATAAMVAVPGLRTFVHETQRSQVVNELQRAFRQAAFSAGQLGETVTVCASSADGRRCAGDGASDWSGGWLAFVDLDGDGAMGAGESRLRLWHTANTHANIAVRATAAAFSFRPYWRRPYEGTAPGRVTVCDRKGHGGQRAIDIDRAGAPRLAETPRARRGCDAPA